MWKPDYQFIRRDSTRQAENLHACLDGGVQGIAKFWMRHAIGQHFRHARHGDDKCNETFIAIFHRLYQFMQHDKKNEGGIINFTLLGGIGDIRINQQATKDEIFEALDFLREG